MNQLVRVFRLYLAVIVTLLVSGCGASLVYKDSANNYLSASRDVTKQLSVVSARLATADDAHRRQLIISDASCPIDRERIFVRMPDDPSIRFSQFIPRYKELADSSSCKAIIACESTGAKGCSNACYTNAEANCLENLDRYFSADDKKRIKSESVSKDEKAADESSSLASLLGKVEYGRTASVPSKFTVDGIKILADYMDLLDKAAKGSKSDLKEKADSLGKRIDTVTDAYSKITSDSLSSKDQATRDSITKSLGALGQMAKDVKEMRDNAKDAEKIKALVSAKEIDIDELLTWMETVATSDDMLGAAQEILDARTARGAIAARYAKTPDPYERGQLLDQSRALKVPGIDATSAALKNVFASLRKSHKTLVSLVKNPTSEQLGQIHNEEFEQFKTFATDAAGVFNQLSGFF